MEQYMDRRNDEGGSIKDIIVDGNREETTKIRCLPRRLMIRIRASKMSAPEG